MTTRKIPLGLLSIALIAAVSTADARGRKFSCPLPDKRTCSSTQQIYTETDGGHGLPQQQLPTQRDHTRDPLLQAAMQPRPAELVGGTPVSSPNRCCSPTNTEVTIKGDTLAVASPVAYPAQASSHVANGYAPPADPHGASGSFTTVPTGAVYASYPAAQFRRQQTVVRAAGNEAFRVPAKVLRIFISPWEDEQGDLHMGGYVFSEVAPRKWSVGARAVNPDAAYRLLTSNSPARDAAQDAKTNEGEATAQVSRTE